MTVRRGLAAILARASQGVALAAGLVVAGCGGDGSSGAPPTDIRLDPTINQAPTAPVGSAGVFVFYVGNVGAQAATDTTIKFSPDTNLKIASVACVPADACTVQSDGSVVLPTLAAVAVPGQRIEIDVTASQVAPKSGDELIVASATQAGDVNAINDVASDTVRFWSADLQVTYTAPATAAPGSTVEFTATIVNNGPDDADNLHVAATFPAGIAGPVGYFCESSDGGCGIQESHRNDSRGLVIPAGTTQTYRIDVTVPATGFASIASTFGVTIDTGSDVDASNDTATATTTVAP